MVAAFTLAQLLHICAPDVGARTMTAIVQVESGGNPLAIHDNTLRRSFSPQDARQAVVWANQLLALHHSVDLGLSQINNANLPRLGLSVTEAFDACSNLSAGSLILAADYRAAARQFGPGQYALRSAIGAYNTGSLFAGYAYVDRILVAAGFGANGPPQMPDLQAIPPAARLPTTPRTPMAKTPAPTDPRVDASKPANSSIPGSSSISANLSVPGNSSTPANLSAPVNLSIAVSSPAPASVAPPVRVVATKPRTVRHRPADKSPILVTIGLPNASRAASAPLLMSDHANDSAIMLRVTPAAVQSPPAH